MVITNSANTVDQPTVHGCVGQSPCYVKRTLFRVRLGYVMLCLGYVMFGLCLGYVRVMLGLG